MFRTSYFSHVILTYMKCIWIYSFDALLTWLRKMFCMSCGILETVHTINIEYTRSHASLMASLYLTAIFSHRYAKVFRITLITLVPSSCPLIASNLLPYLMYVI